MFKIVLIDWNTDKRIDTLTYDSEETALRVAALANKAPAVKAGDHCYVVEAA